MKALTIKQPWAWAILHAGKDVENRSVRYKYRGPLLIHAAAVMARDAELPRGVRAPPEERLVLGAIIGIVDVVDGVETRRSRWWEGPYGLVLAKPRVLRRPVPCKGRLSLWTPSPSVLAAVRRQLR